VPLLVREQHLLIRVLEELRIRLPFTLRGLDVDNDSVFINEVLQGYCRFHEIEFTRCRPYRKNDQAWVEQKNGAVVRRAIGYRRYEGLEGSRLLARLYEALRGYVNFFQPSFKLQSKERQEARIIKRYYAPSTPCQRLLESRHADARMTDALKAEEHALDPIRLLHTVRLAQEALAAHSDRIIPGSSRPPGADTLDAFLNGLKAAWHSGPIARPTHRRRATTPRGRTVPDPIASVTTDLERWFAEDVTCTSRELLNLLQTHYPGQYTETVLRTIQRRLKGWRARAIERLYTPVIACPVPPDRAARRIDV
jgi:hypothetical protein